MFEFAINSKGRPQQAVVIKSIPEGVFDRYSLAALKRFRYDPSKTNKGRQPAVTNNIFSFSLPGQDMASKRVYWENECQ